MTHGDINTYLRPEEVGAVEVYQAGEVPVQCAATTQTVRTVIVEVPGNGRAAGSMGTFGALRGGTGTASGNVGGTGCMKIVVWTKARLGLK